MPPVDSERKGTAMTITLEVPPRLEGPLRDRMARDGDAEVQRLLEAAFACALQAMLVETPPPLSDAEFEALADELADTWEADGGPKNMVPADDAHQPRRHRKTHRSGLPRRYENALIAMAVPAPPLSTSSASSVRRSGDPVFA